MDIEIRPFDLNSKSSGEWSRLGEFTRDIQNEFWPNDAWDIDTNRTMIQAQQSEYNMVAYKAVDLQQKKRVVGFSRMLFLREHSPSYGGNEHICQAIGPFVLSEYRRSGLATKMLPFIYDEVKKAGRHSIIGTVLNEAGRNLVRKIGGREAQRIQENRLVLSDVDWKMVNKWVDDGPRRSPKTRIEFYHSIPDDILEKYCDVYTEVQNQAPRDELEVGDSVVTPESWRTRMEKLAEGDMKYLAAVTIEKNGDISGLTDVAWFPSRPSVLMQWLTGVQERYRGRGLGKWLKGAVLLKIQDEFPGVTAISTGNAASNEPMLDINRRLGFKLYRDMYQYQLELEQLKKYLQK